jgi:Mrp family chromosome partitioning ATPase/predicted Fe-Mo cluster-binding NifX family protein
LLAALEPETVSVNGAVGVIKKSKTNNFTYQRGGIMNEKSKIFKPKTVEKPNQPSKTNSRGAGSTEGNSSGTSQPRRIGRMKIAVLSGKGGVGKSLITALLATYLQRTGKYRVGILEADVTGPSIPKLFGADEFRPKATEVGLFPVRSHSDIQLMSINLLLEEPDAPVIWRGPILANTVKQFWTDVIWGDIDFMFLDMPPGTGDIPLTVFQSIPLDGIIIVTSPKDLVYKIGKKAVNMAKMMHIPILGLVENMSHAVCPHCGETIKLFGESVTEDIALEWGIPFLGSLPIDPDLARLCDEGHIERIHKPYLTEAIAALEKVPARVDPFLRQAMANVKSVPAGDEKPAFQSDDALSASAETRKVAIASERDSVCAHFGHCEGFAIYSTAAGKIVSQEFLPNPGHKPGLLPNLLNDQGVRVVIAGGMGAGAIDIFNEKGIDVVTGASGPVEQTILNFLTGQLISSGSVCHDHQHSGECGGHD